MRKRFTHLVLASALSTPLIACDEVLDNPVVGDAETLGDVDEDGTGDADADEAGGPTAILIVDRAFDGKCRATSNSHGADIDAVELLPAGSETSLYLATVIGDVPARSGEPLAIANPPSCDNDFDALDAAEGPPDASQLVPAKDTQYVSLHGGWIAGEFDDTREIAVGDQIVVHEVGTNLGGSSTSDEHFDLYVLTDLTCTDATDTTCAFKVGEGFGVAEFDVVSLPF